jgi:hypothetical protein
MTVQVVQMFPPTVLTATAATLFTNTGFATLARGRIRFTNTSASPVQVTAYAVPSGATAGATNEFCPALAVLGNSNLDLDVPVLSPGDFIEAFASTASVITALSLDGVLFMS